jgi:hypothetical protein
MVLKELGIFPQYEPFGIFHAGDFSGDFDDAHIATDVMEPITSHTPGLEDPAKNNRWDISLVVPPDAKDDYVFFENLQEKIYKRVGKTVYSPHDELLHGGNLEDEVVFATQTAIPRSKLVIVGFGCLTPQVREMWSVTVERKKPFLIFYPQSATPFSDDTARRIRNSRLFRGEVKYTTSNQAIERVAEAVIGVPELRS